MTLLTDRETLTQLNDAYIRASLDADAAWFDAHLADNFMCISHDTTWYDKPRFLQLIAAGSDQAVYRLVTVDIKITGDTGVVRAIGSWRTHAGVTGTSHYTDVYAKIDGVWKAVSAQITRPT
jgi:hypothetical protein